MRLRDFRVKIFINLVRLKFVYFIISHSILEKRLGLDPQSSCCHSKRVKLIHLDFSSIKACFDTMSQILLRNFETILNKDLYFS